MNIAILSRDVKLYSTRRLKEAGEARGHKVEIINHMKCVLIVEKKILWCCTTTVSWIISML